MSTWTVVDDDRDGVVTHISDAGRRKLADEQHTTRLARVEPLYEKVWIGALAGSVASIALLIIFH